MLTEVFNAPCACPNTLSESNHGGLHEKGEGRNGGGRDTAEEFRMQAAKATVECGVPTWLAVFFFFSVFPYGCGPQLRLLAGPLRYGNKWPNRPYNTLILILK
jgi:hypothetical protein